jgi:hypothetical protein
MEAINSCPPLNLRQSNAPVAENPGFPRVEKI